MNTRTIALTCTLTAVACSNSSTRPAQDVSSATPTTASDSSDTSPAPQPEAAATNQAVEKKAIDYKPASGVSPDAVATPVTPAASPNPSVADGSKNTKNTKTNTRDRQNTLTPLDQGNSAAETTITANIRKGIIGDKTVSFNGKNVKIVTIGTKVTLRGPVKNAAERATIESIAKRTAGVSDVDNQLEVSN